MGKCFLFAKWGISLFLGMGEEKEKNVKKFGRRRLLGIYCVLGKYASAEQDGFVVGFSAREIMYGFGWRKCNRKKGKERMEEKSGDLRLF